MNYRFAQPDAFWGFVPLILFGLFLLWRYYRSPEWFSWRRFCLVMGGFFFALIGLARPQLGTLAGRPEPIAANLFVAIDISNSMLVEDITPNRLEFSILFVQKVLEQLVKPRAAVFPFAASGFLQLPLTTDTFAVQESLLALDPTATSHQGTDFNETLSDLMISINQLEKQSVDKLEEWNSPRILLLSDGESHVPLKDDSLKPFVKKNIPIYTVGVGTPNGGQVLVPRPFAQPELLHDPQTGTPARSQLNSGALEKIAMATGGSYFSSAFENVPILVNQLNQSLTLGKRMSQFKVQQEFFPFCFFLALILFFIEWGFGRWHYVIRTAVILLVFSSSGLSFGEDDQLKGIQTYNQGLEQLKVGNLEKATELFEESALILQDPTQKKKALYNLGNVFLKMGDPEQALESYQKAYLTQSSSKEFETSTNKSISENMVLASQFMEQMQQQKRSGKDSEDGDQQTPKDLKGPQQFKGESLSEQQKQKLYDLIGSEERQTLKRLREKNKPPGPQGGKPW